MKRFIFFFATLYLLLPMAVAQQYVVISVTGHVEVVTNGGAKHEVALREKLTPTNVINVPFKGQLELLDEKNQVKYTLKTVGQATLSNMVTDKRNTMLRLTEQYLAYLKSRLQGNGELTSRRHSDPATVTREVVAKKDDFEEEFNTFRRQAQVEYDKFRQQAIREYADFVRKTWHEFGAKPAHPKPTFEERPPVYITKEDRMKPLKSVSLPIDKVVLRLPKSTPQPVPITPIQEQKVDVAEYVDFMYYGTPLHVRFTKADLFKLPSATPDGVADVFARLAETDMNNTIRDCLELRIRHQLSDWAYLLMLDSLSQACLPNKNEATLLMAYLYQQSGYKMRLGVANGQLCLLYATKHHMYGKSYFYIEGEDFYAYTYESEHMNICEATFPKEQSMSLLITATPMLAENATTIRQLQAEYYPNMNFTSVVNKNLIDFYNDYPTSMLDGNFITRWGMYANTPLDASVQSTLVPALRKELEGLNKLDAVEHLLNWIQTAFVYEYDDKVWGDDRAFFAEETLYYPYCDCEDRSILLSRLVRDLLGLKVLLVYYPGHLATAICFDDETVEGDYIELDGQHYIVCDPTFIGAKVGQTMPSMDNSIAKVLLLE